MYVCHWEQTDERRRAHSNGVDIGEEWWCWWWWYELSIELELHNAQQGDEYKCVRNLKLTRKWAVAGEALKIPRRRLQTLLGPSPFR